MASFYGNSFKLSIFGQSHGEAIGVVIDGIPSGKRIDLKKLENFLRTRAPGQNDYSTSRREADIPEFISGLVDGVTCGAPLCAIIRNTNVDSSGYEELRYKMRPGHADYTALIKYGGNNDHRGGGHFSGRLTAPLCIAGGIAMQLLEESGIFIGAHIADIAGLSDEPYDLADLDLQSIQRADENDFPVNDANCGAIMKQAIDGARDEGDSLGGIIECAAIGLPVGLGEPIFDGVENKISTVVFAIPGIRGIEFGSGFTSTFLRGSANNDAFYLDNGIVRTKTNNHGGILGGVTSSMPLVFRVAIKPTPSISLPQDTVSIIRDPKSGTLMSEETNISIKGRHDPCIVPRAVPCVKAAAAIALYDLLKMR